MREPAVAIRGVTLAVVCCAGAPLLIGAIGGLTVAVLGWSALAVAALAFVAIVLTHRNGRSDRR
ncbi:MAG: hypothetical protein H0T69_08040 [Thermoleophilaceae bacterium]|nr:hypothetical protein [Thermoleophilaceae bacterium]